MSFEAFYQALFDFLGNFCHQIPERSWWVAGHQLPLCVRCTALTLGALGAVLVIFARRPLPSPRSSIVLLAPMSVELLLQALGLFESSNALRASTGVLFGFASLPAILQPLAAWGGPASAARASSCSRADPFGARPPDTGV